MWDEFEEYSTEDAKFAHLLDNFQPLLLNDASDGKSWAEHGVHKAQVCKRNERIADFRRPALRCRRRRQFPVRTQYRVADAAHHPEQYARFADAAFRVGRSPDALGQ